MRRGGEENPVTLRQAFCAIWAGAFAVMSLARLSSVLATDMGHPVGPWWPDIHLMLASIFGSLAALCWRISLMPDTKTPPLTDGAGQD